MFKKFLRTKLPIILALSLMVLPSHAAFAQVVPATLSTTSANTETASTKTGYEAVKELAEKKAATLTSIYGVTSLQYAVIDNGAITVSGQSGVYSKEANTPLTNTHMYGIGSISKIFTTAAVMQLSEDGKVDLDAPVTKYIPEFTMADERYKDITVRMLLNHSAGLMGSTLESAMLFDDNDFSTYDSFLEKLKTSRLKAAPGAYSVYSNDGFTLAEVLVEKVSGVSFTEYIRKNITSPLRLSNTKTPLDTFPSSNLAKTYLPGESTALPKEYLNMIGAGGIYSTAEDLCRFAEIFMSTYSSDVLYSASAKAMEYPEYSRGVWPEDTEPALLSYGLGWDSVKTYPFEDYDIKAVVKGGDTSYYHGSLIILPNENMAVAILSSGGSSAYNQAMGQEILLKALLEKGTIDTINPDKTFSQPVQTQVPEALLKYQGIYGQRSGLYQAKIDKSGTLTLTDIITPGATAQKFIYTGDGKFYYTDGSMYYSFKEESNGKTYLYASGYSLLPGIAQLGDSSYQAQKLSDNPISASVKKLWQQRMKETYFIVNEKYSSQLYALGALGSTLIMPKELQGYVITSAIVDEYTAESPIQIPGASAGRDLMDFTFYKKDGKEYLNAAGRIGIAEKNIGTLSTKSTFTTTIGEEGDAIWYKIGKGSAKKSINVILPINSSFAVYNADGTCVNYSIVSKDPTVILPEGGYIVFAGDANSTIRVRYTK
jgi:CubicO group peptidase (beta-lactamase class C family)